MQDQFFDTCKVTTARIHAFVISALLLIWPQIFGFSPPDSDRGFATAYAGYLVRLLIIFPRNSAAKKTLHAI
jgi:hypothetical protein